MKKHRKKFKKQFEKMFPNFEYVGKSKTKYGNALTFKSSNFCVGIVIPIEFRNQTITPELWAKVHTSMYQCRTMGHHKLLIWFEVI